MPFHQVRYFLRPRPSLPLKHSTQRYTLRSRASQPFRTVVCNQGTSNKEGYIYLIREREFVRMKEDIYKVGRSKDFEKRFASYPKNSEILACAFLKDQFGGEKRVIQTFDKVFVQRSDIGREYYEGDRHKVLQEFLQLAMQLHTDS